MTRATPPRPARSHSARPRPASAPHRAKALSIWAVAVALILAGCTAGTPTGSGAGAPASGPAGHALPPSAFAPLAGRGPGVRDSTLRLAAVGPNVVASATRDGNVAEPAYRVSSDGGRTWSDGRLSDVARAAATPSDDRSGILLGRPASGGSGAVWFDYGRTTDARHTWTSTDGRVWERRAIQGVDPQASVVAGVATADGIVLVGSTAGSDGAGHPAAWTSTDGLRFTGRSIPAGGWFSAVAARGRTLVAVGGRDRADDQADRVREPVVFRSTDAGATWKPAGVPTPEDGEFSFTLTDVEGSGSGFAAVGTFYRDDYEVAALTSRDGASWALAPELTMAGGSATGAQIVRTPRADVVLANVDSAQGSETRGVRREGPGWSTIGRPASGPATIMDAVSAGDAVVAAADVRQADGHGRPEAWLLSAGGAGLESVPLAVPAEGAPVVEGLRFVRDAAGVRVAGAAQGASVVWARPRHDASGAAASDAGFGPPSLVADSDRESVSGGVAHGDEVLLFGRRDVGGSEYAQTWLQRGGTTAVSGPDTFSTTGLYRFSDIHGAAWAGDRWVVVGERSGNGDVRASALVATSADGVHWQAGRHQRVFRRGDGYGKSDALTDLDGLAGTSRTMLSVAGLGAGLVAVGSVTERGLYRPAAWLSSDKATWRLVPLPLGRASEAGAHEVAVLGTTIVAAGRAMIGRNLRTHAWTSTDAGKTWREAPLGPDDSPDRVKLVVARGRIVALVGTEPGRGLMLLTSADGSSWHPVDAPALAVPTGAPWRMSAADLTPAGDGVDVLVRTSSASDGRSTVVHVPLR